ncbi:DUF7344 domain-containing protein [Halovivax gelatinilyticus]|uniref:DUF7344 domain-containing protein n=1 Tax=Halovivax gelatinilyticus TaxID=2961597 RepID=UPI0020CA6502|nr:ArsR family transcriptional regulator [Halovivax gelatinilyticus]
MATPIDPDRVFSLLSEPDRRHVLTCLDEKRIWPTDALARELAVRDGSGESHRQLDEPKSAHVREKHILLVHNHLPRLTDYGVIEWDRRSGDVVRTDRFEQIVSYLELASGDDHRLRTEAI